MGQNNNSTYLGSIDIISNTKIIGWSLKINDVGIKIPAKITIRYEDSTYQVNPSDKRPDVQEVYGVEKCGFTFTIPFSEKNKKPRFFFENSNEELKYSQMVQKDTIWKITEISENKIQGWAYNTDVANISVDLEINNKYILSTIASKQSKELNELGLNNGVGNFIINIPKNIPTNKDIDIKLKILNEIIFHKNTKRPPLNILIVSETDNLTDASRKYRCDNLANILRKTEINTHTININDFNTKEWTDFEIIIFARCGFNDEGLSKVINYKNNGVKIIYEIDDLVFMPWHIHDIGSVRSGVDEISNVNFTQMISNRLRLLTVSDAAITTTRKIAFHLEAMGINTFILPNLIHQHEIVNRNISNINPKILCMSGSPTHYKDFEEIEDVLYKILKKNKDVSLTLLGRFKESLKLTELQNVIHLPRVDYKKMLSIISDHDLCLVPLEKTEFNDAKSCLKYIECSARCVPIIASPCEDYINLKNLLICNEDIDWENSINEFIGNPEKFRSMALIAQKNIKNNYCLETYNPTKLVEWLKR